MEMQNSARSVSDVLKRHHLEPTENGVWSGDVWHSYNGLCNRDGQLVFAKIFLPHLQLNMRAEVMQNQIFTGIDIQEIRAPRILDYDYNDLLVLQEPIEQCRCIKGELIV